MKIGALPGVWSLSLLSVVVAFVGCGSDDAKKLPRSPGSAGEAGAAVGDGGSDAEPNGPGGATAVGGSGSGLAGEGGGAITAAGSGEQPPLGGAAGAGGEGPVVPFNGLYIGEDGDDTAAGTVEAPFATLQHAVSVAQSGDTVVFLDGAYTKTGAARVVVPDGVNLMAQTPGLATISGTNASNYLDLAGSSQIEGLTFVGFANVIHFVDGPTATGQLKLVDTTFGDCAQACIEASGATDVIITADGGHLLSDGGGTYLQTLDQATASITGGEIKNHAASPSAGAGILHASGESQIQVADLLITDGGGRALSVQDEAEMVVQGSTFATLGQQLAVLRHAGRLEIQDSDLSIKPAVQTPYECIRNEGLTAGMSELVVAGSKLHGCSTAINAELPAKLTVTDSELYDLSVAGMDLGYGAGTVRITATKIYDTGIYSIRIGGSGQKIDFKMRGSEVEAGSGASGNDAMRIDGSSSSIYDFGTLLDPGQNTILGTSSTITGMRVMLSAVTVQAVGNTWSPTQGADAEGHYAVVTGKVYELTSPVSTGQNVIAGYSGVTVRLAQIP
jgi:hypothetical protein